ncbi:MAG: hypothetical protein WAV18_15480 [Roseiarcus sp.]
MVSKSIVAASAIPAGKISRTAERAEGESIDSPAVRRIVAMEFDEKTLIASYLTRSLDNGVGVLRENTSIGLTLFDQNVSHEANPASPESRGV